MHKPPAHAPEYLQRLWQLTAHDQAIAMLRHVFHEDMSLADVLEVLTYRELPLDPRTVTLREVFAASAPQKAVPPSPRPIPTPTPLAVPPRAPAAARSRRGPQQTAQIREIFLTALRRADAGLRTHELAALLPKAGLHKVNPGTTNAVLKSMEQDSLVEGNQSRPKVWRAKLVGRRVPEPIVIRRPAELRVVKPSTAEAPAATPPPPPAPAVAPTAVGAGAAGGESLLSQAEVAAAAALLRERFFK